MSNIIVGEIYMCETKKTQWLCFYVFAYSAMNPILNCIDVEFASLRSSIVYFNLK